MPRAENLRFPVLEGCWPESDTLALQVGARFSSQSVRYVEVGPCCGLHHKVGGTFCKSVVLAVRVG